MVVLQRIVVVGGDDQFAACGQLERRFELVGQLPVEIVFRHAEQSLLASVGIDDGVFEVLAPQMSMRLKLVDRHRFGVGGYANHFIILSARRYRWNRDRGTLGLLAWRVGKQLLAIGDDGFSRRGHSKQLMLRWLRAEPEANFCLIFFGL